MSERQWSLADRFVFVANEIARMNDDVDNENPHRYPLRKMKQTAEKILFEAMTTATSAYVLAVRMGGKGELVAQAVTVSTLCGMIALPVWLNLAR